MGEELSKGEEAKKGYDDDYDYEDVATSSSFRASSCGCFRGICSSWRRPDGYFKCDQIQKEEEEEAGKKKKYVKVLSEWKNLIRQRLRLRMRMNKKKRRSMQVFQYDPESYALNFDDGTQKEDDAYVDFSARYAHPDAVLGITNKGDSGCHVSELSKVLDLIRL